MMQASRQPAIEQMRSTRSAQQPTGTWITWHTEDDVAIRRTVIQRIFQLFQTKKPVISPEWQDKLPDFVKRLEEVLYQLARTKDEYSDPGSLEERLQRVARRMAQNPGGNQGSGRPTGTVNGSPIEGRGLAPTGLRASNHYGVPMFVPSMSTDSAPAGPGLDFNQSGAQAPVMIPVNHDGLAHPQHAPSDRGAPNMIPTPSLLDDSGSMMADGHGRGSMYEGQMGNGAAVVRGTVPATWETTMIPTANTMPAGMSGIPEATVAAPNMIPNPGMGPGMGGGMGAGMVAGVGAGMQPGSVPGGAPGMGAGLGLSAMNGSAVSLRALISVSRRPGGPLPQDKAAVKLQINKHQRMLLFLRHCAKCADPGCQYGANCKVGKELWQHIMQCTNAQCTHQRCVSSRELLRHYQACQQDTCPVCGPVKDYVRRNQSNNGVTQPAGSEGVAMMQRAGNGRRDAHGGMVPSHLAGQGASHMERRRPPPLPTEQPPMKRSNLGPGNRLQNNMGTSLLEVFSEEEIEMHLQSTRVEMAARPPSRPSNQLQMPDGEICLVCNQHVLRFEPPLLYCTSCNTRIRKNQPFYASVDPLAYWCSQCYTNTPGDELKLENMAIKKSLLTKRKNEEQEDEPWVACDMCNRWVHMICGLFNKGRNTEDTHYLCPWCLLDTARNGQRQPITNRPQSMLQASELPHCKLSTYLEQHLMNALEVDWMLRNKRPGVHERVKGLSLRVVNISSKKVEVKDQFRKAFRDHNCAAAFPYTQKVLLLFQKIEGVDVLLMVIYVQEYGEDAAMPNKRTIYLSYLDSVKYFRPEADAHKKSISLRTYVYHELLLGYMAFAKNVMGMNAMYIWSCPPLAGDDYVLYCHPSKQKNPKADKLREWYHAILREAQLRNIVTRVSTLCDTYLPEGRDHAILDCSATHIPYFEGDFWPGEAEAQLTVIENGISHQPGKKGKKPPGKARGKSSVKTKRIGPATTDGQLLQRLMDTLGSNQNNMKEDFIVAHFRVPCSTCRNYCDGVKFELNKRREDLPQVKIEKFEGIELPQQEPRPDLPRHFAICEGCYKMERAALETGIPTKLPNAVTVADLAPVECERIPRFEDPDHQMDCDIFDTRNSFLQLCQGNHFQFDTLRRAKHSSMMTLYHLHNPNEPAFAGNCNLCQGDIEPGAGYRCSHSKCQDFDMCKNCYNKGLASKHPHPLMRSSVDERSQRMTAEQRTARTKQLQRTIQLLEHASACKDDNCRSNSCRRVKQLHRHAFECTKKVSGGCTYCKHMWLLLQLHAKQCCNNNCPVPRCSDLRELRRRQAAREQDGRRSQYIKWNRQQSAAVVK